MNNQEEYPKAIRWALDRVFRLSNGDLVNDLRQVEALCSEWMYTSWIKVPENKLRIIDELRNNYEQQKEQLYIVPIFTYESKINRAYGIEYLVIDDSGEWNTYSTERGESIAEVESKVNRIIFTIAEIEAKDPRYKAFAVPVKEVKSNEE